MPKPRCDHTPEEVKVQAETLCPLLYLSLLFPWNHFSTTAAQGLQATRSPPLWGQTGLSQFKGGLCGTGGAGLAGGYSLAGC